MCVCAHVMIIPRMFDHSTHTDVGNNSSEGMMCTLAHVHQIMNDTFGVMYVHVRMYVHIFGSVEIVWDCYMQYTQHFG